MNNYNKNKSHYGYAYYDYKELLHLINSWGGRIIETEGKIYYLGWNDFGQTELKNKRAIRTIRRKGIAQKVIQKITWKEGLHFVDDVKPINGE